MGSLTPIERGARVVKRLGIVAMLCCVLAVGFSFVGCGGSAVDKANYTGDWVLVASTDEDLDADSIALMQSLGLEVRLTLNEDGTGKFDMFDDVYDVTWEAKSNSEGTLKMDDVQTSIRVANGELVLADVDESSLTFRRS